MEYICEKEKECKYKGCPHDKAHAQIWACGCACYNTGGIKEAKCIPVKEGYPVFVRTFEEDGRSWREKYEESEASRRKLKDGVTSLAQLYTEALSKIPVRCLSCQRFLDRTGRCDYCARKTLDHPDSKEAQL